MCFCFEGSLKEADETRVAAEASCWFASRCLSSCFVFRRTESCCRKPDLRLFSLTLLPRVLCSQLRFVLCVFLDAVRPAAAALNLNLDHISAPPPPHQARTNGDSCERLETVQIDFQLCDEAAETQTVGLHRKLRRADDPAESCEFMSNQDQFCSVSVGGRQLRALGHNQQSVVT